MVHFQDRPALALPGNLFDFMLDGMNVTGGWCGREQTLVYRLAQRSLSGGLASL
jgi:hypothetical protein